MSPAGSERSDAGHNNHALGHECQLLFTQKETDIFGTFLDEFTGGYWASQGMKITSQTSPFVEEDCGSQKSHSTLLAGDASMGASTRDGLLSHAPLPDSVVPGTQSTASSETGVNFTPGTDPEKTGVNVPGTPSAASVGNKTLAFSFVRKLSSATYLRRMYLSRDDAVAVFPELQKTMDFVFMAVPKRCISQDRFKVDISVALQDHEGRRWPVVLECLRSAGQRHVRFNKGWAKLCRANGLSVGKRIRFARWNEASSTSDALVTVSLL